jgi:opacity protein-like surface antigen
MFPTARVLAVALALAACATLVPSPSRADGKVSIYLSRMVPADLDARRFSRTSWGGGLDAVLPWYAARNLVAATAGIELSNMLSKTLEIYDPYLRETLDQNTNQSYGRFFVGGRLGPHGPAFLRPHVGTNVAIVWYGISTTIDYTDPYDSSKTISKTLDSNFKAAFGYDVNAGLDLNIANTVPVELGARYVKTFNVPQSLGVGSVSVSPSYIQTYLAVGVGMNRMKK